MRVSGWEKIALKESWHDYTKYGDDGVIFICAELNLALGSPHGVSMAPHVVVHCGWIKRRQAGLDLPVGIAPPPPPNVDQTFILITPQSCRLCFSGGEHDSMGLWLWLRWGGRMDGDITLCLCTGKLYFTPLSASQLSVLMLWFSLNPPEVFPPPPFFLPFRPFFELLRIHWQENSKWG